MKTGSGNSLSDASDEEALCAGCDEEEENPEGEEGAMRGFSYLEI